ncbi:MAG: tetraacyldisaccharide 4'-kinase [Pseudomonadales bacterium]|nr:tetraacyldisaccharide 4'-kinase [Pseudomonadales bacterium]
MNFLERAWYRKAGWLILLWPLAIVFQGLAALRRSLQSINTRPDSVSVPIVVVGNITVGGTGKTPLLIALCQHLKTQGIHPGIISRGFGGKAANYPMLVGGNDSPAVVGDEALLIARNTKCPVVVDPDRNSALQHLLSREQVDVVLSDDGLQHYKLFRDIEIVVVDGHRRFGNGLCLPAGPLRESVSRLDSVDFIIVNGADGTEVRKEASAMEMEPKFLVNLATGEKRPFSGAPFNMGNTLQAVCGIGNPARFYTALEKLPYLVEQFTFPDHHPFSLDDFVKAEIDNNQPVVMTEKDAVKCEDFAKNNFWYLQAEVNLQAAFLNEFTKKVKDSINDSN